VVAGTRRFSAGSFRLPERLAGTAQAPTAVSDDERWRYSGGVVDAALRDLGRLSYRDAHAVQLALVEQRGRGEGRDTLVLVEHPHVITLGRRRSSLDNVVAPGEVEIVPIERGGDVTYHGPGQLVAYPIFLLRDGERDLHRFLRNLEEAALRALADHGIAADRAAGKTGVWIEGRKLASIGIACRRWVIFHGLALNVNTDLDYFRRINPCGFDAGVMTSMARELGVDQVDFDAVKRSLVDHAGEVFGRALALPAAR
jgi:lipoyl(octanoyl) transferase